jgi:chromate reductase, NAD(P)H dehydrogenase (quinone)
MNAPEAYIQFTPGLIADDGNVTTPSTEQFLQMYMNAFYAFIQRVYTVLPRNSWTFERATQARCALGADV